MGLIHYDKVMKEVVFKDPYIKHFPKRYKGIKTPEDYERGDLIVKEVRGYEVDVFFELPPIEKELKNKRNQEIYEVEVIMAVKNYYKTSIKAKTEIDIKPFDVLTNYK